MSKFKEGTPINVSFNLKIRPDGDFTLMRITQGEQEVQLTRAQVETLGIKIKERLEQLR